MVAARSLHFSEGAAVRARSVGHSAHFLERLDRVPRSLTDFALGLYRDEARVRWIVNAAHLPAEESRVALAIGPAGDGPYVVVTREGKFVTALGAEMTPRNLPILSRGQIDAFSTRLDETRARFKQATAIVPPGKHTLDVVGLLEARGHSLSREEFSAIAAWAPILAPRFVDDAYGCLPHIDEIRARFLAHRSKRFRNAPVVRKALHAAWSASHGVGARFALAAMSDLAWAPPWAAAWDSPSGPTCPATLERVHSIAMRGAWAAARLGKPFVSTYRRILSTPGHPHHRFDAVLAMTAIGLRHGHYRDDARRAIEAMPESADPPDLPWEKAIVAASLRAFDAPEAALREVAAHGAAVLVAHVGSFPAGSRYRFLRVEDVPRETALLVAANQSHDSLLPHALSSLPWVAKLASAEELYYPEEMAIGLHVEWTPELMEIPYARTRPPKPIPEIRDAPKLSRNAPCACGSGRKHKKCCGR